VVLTQCTRALGLYGDRRGAVEADLQMRFFYLLGGVTARWLLTHSLLTHFHVDMVSREYVSCDDPIHPFGLYLYRYCLPLLMVITVGLVLARRLLQSYMGDLVLVLLGAFGGAVISLLIRPVTNNMFLPG